MGISGGLICVNPFTFARCSQSSEEGFGTTRNVRTAWSRSEERSPWGCQTLLGRRCTLSIIFSLSNINCGQVEFLYEDTGGLPRDLTMPGLEQMHEERCKLQLHHLRRGQKVVIKKAADGINIGIVGQLSRVLEVDVALELVMVDTYLAEEGRLVRFWHPLSSLAKPEESTGPEDLPDLSSLVLHKELLSWEAARIRLGARAACLNLLEHNEDVYTTDNLADLSASLLESPGDSNLLQDHMGPRLPASRVLELSQGKASSIFYQQQPEALTRKLDKAIYEAVEEGTLRQMTTKLCSCLKLAPFGFSTEEIEVFQLIIII